MTELNKKAPKKPTALHADKYQISMSTASHGTDYWAEGRVYRFLAGKQW